MDKTSKLSWRRIPHEWQVYNLEWAELRSITGLIGYCSGGGGD
jgi:hypothetical protein